MMNFPAHHGADPLSEDGLLLWAWAFHRQERTIRSSFEVDFDDDEGRKRLYNSSQPFLITSSSDFWPPASTYSSLQALEAAYDRGICRSLGVSNYLKKHLEETHGEGQEICTVDVDVGWCWLWFCDILMFLYLYRYVNTWCFCIQFWFENSLLTFQHEALRKAFVKAVDAKWRRLEWSLLTRHLRDDPPSAKL